MNNSLSYMPQINLAGSSSSANMPPIPSFSAAVSGLDSTAGTGVSMTTTDSVDLRRHPSGIVPVLQ